MDVLPLRKLDRRPVSSTFAGFDAIRAFAAFGVVMLHACVPYLQNPMPGLSWSTRDTPSAWIDVGFWTIELFIMPLFLVLAGFLAWQTFDRRGPRSLVRHRAKRLLRPFVFGCAIVLPIDLYIWVLSWVAEGFVEPTKLRSLKFDGVIDRDLWGTAHLWFLPYLFLYIAVFAVAAWASRKISISNRFRFHPMIIGASLIVAASVILFFRPHVVWGFQHSGGLVPSKWGYSGLFFAAGLLIAWRDPHLNWLKSIAARLIVPAALAAIAAVTLGRWHLSGGDGRFAGAVLAAITVLAAALLTFSIVGISAKQVHVSSVRVKYIAAASFWIYLVHHPILGLVHIDLKLLLPGVSPIVKVMAAFAVSVGLSLVTYEVMVRKTMLGRWLGFDWALPGESSGDLEQPAEILALPSTSPDVRRAA